MDLSLVQTIADGISDLLMSQNRTSAMGLLFYLQKI